MIPVGIDVSKKTLDVHYGTQKRPRFRLHCPNTEAGFEQIVSWFQGFDEPSHQLHICLEATNTYSDGIAHFLVKRGYRISVVNPTRIARFRKAEPVHGKTDRMDAWILARYVDQKHPDFWIPMQSHQQDLQVLVQRLDDVKQMIGQERNRLENQRLTERVKQSIATVLACLKEEEAQIAKEIQDHIEAHEDLKEQQALLISIKGIAELTAARILSSIGSIDRFASARRLAAFACVVPSPYSSGTSVRKQTKIEHSGTPNLRAWLYMPAMTAMRWDPAMKTWSQQLRDRGKTEMQIIVAVIRKMLHLVYGVLKHKQPYDRNLAFPWWQEPQPEQERSIA